MSTPDPTDPDQPTPMPGPDEAAGTGERTTTPGPDDTGEEPLPPDHSNELVLDDHDGHQLFMSASLPSTLAPAVAADLLAALTATLPAGVRIDHLSLTHEEDDGEDEDDPMVALQAGDRVHLRTSSGATLGRVVKVHEPEGRPAEVTVEDEPLYGLWVAYPDGGPAGWVTRTDGSVVLGPLSEIVKIKLSGAAPRLFPTPAHPAEVKSGGGVAAMFTEMMYGRPRPIEKLAFPHTHEENQWTTTT